MTIANIAQDWMACQYTDSYVMGFLEDRLQYLGFGRNNISEVDPHGDGTIRIHTLTGKGWDLTCTPVLLHVYQSEYQLRLRIVFTSVDTGEVQEWWA